MARANNPPNTRLSPQFSIDTAHDMNDTKATAPGAEEGTRAIASMSFATGGEVATTYPVSTTIAIWRVNSARSQKPPPNASATSSGLEPLTSAAPETTTTPISAKT